MDVCLSACLSVCPSVARGSGHVPCVFLSLCRSVCLSTVITLCRAAPRIVGVQASHLSLSVCLSTTSQAPAAPAPAACMAAADSVAASARGGGGGVFPGLCSQMSSAAQSAPCRGRAECGRPATGRRKRAAAADHRLLSRPGAAGSRRRGAGGCAPRRHAGNAAAQAAHHRLLLRAAGGGGGRATAAAAAGARGPCGVGVRQERGRQAGWARRRNDVHSGIRRRRARERRLVLSENGTLVLASSVLRAPSAAHAHQQPNRHRIATGARAPVFLRRLPFIWRRPLQLLWRAGCRSKLMQVPVCSSACPRPSAPAAALRRQAAARMADGSRHVLCGRLLPAQGHQRRALHLLVPDALPLGPLRWPVVQLSRRHHPLQPHHRQPRARAPQGGLHEEPRPVLGGELGSPPPPLQLLI
jgi:hypothetical protein